MVNEYLYVWLTLWFIFSISLVLGLDKKLMDERAKPGPGGTDYFTARCTRLLYAMHALLLVYASIKTSQTKQHYFAFTGTLIFVLGMIFVYFSMKINLFFSSVIRIQNDRGHQVITKGVYQTVRHPGYLGMTMLILGGSLMVTDIVSLSILVPWLIVILRRIHLEEKTLLKELKNYNHYTQNVRWKLIPGIY